MLNLKTQITLPKAEFDALTRLNWNHGKGDIIGRPTYNPFTGIGYVALRCQHHLATARFHVKRDGSRVTIRYKGHKETIKTN